MISLSYMPSLENLGVTRREGKLANGIRVILFEKTNAPLSLNVIFRSGARYDESNKEGTSHFVEHMLVAGTSSFPRKDKLSIFIERLGGMVGAVTNSELLTIETGVSEPADLSSLGKLLKEVLTMTLFENTIIETERGAILKEIGIMKANPARACADQWRKLAFQKTRLENGVLGTPEAVTSIQKDELLSFFRKHINAQRATIVAAGGIKLDTLISRLDEDLADMPDGDPLPTSIEELPIIRDEHTQVTWNDGVDHVQLVFGFRTVPLAHRDSYVLDFLANTIGAGRSSVLASKLRYEKGLIYNVSASSQAGSDWGTWSISTSTSPVQLNLVLSEIANVLNEVRENGLSDEMIQTNKESAIKAMRRNLQTSESWVRAHSHFEALSPSRMTIIDRVNQYASITNDEIKMVAQKYFTPHGWYLSIHGKIKEADIVLPNMRP